MAETLGQSLGELPDAPIAPGKSWNTKSTTPAVMGLVMQESGTRTFVKREGDVVVISETSTLFNEPNQELAVPMPTRKDAAPPVTKMTMTGNSNGEIRIDEKTGLARSHRSKSQNKTAMKMENIDGKGAKMEMEIEMIQESTSTTELLPPETELETKIPETKTAPAL